MADDSWEDIPLRAEKRIRRQIREVTFRLWDGLTLAQVARLPGAPGLRTMRRWASENLCGFGKEYHLILRGRAVERIRAGLQADLGKIRARVDRAEQRADARELRALRRNRTESRTG
jgi:hypothetical protein